MYNNSDIYNVIIDKGNHRLKTCQPISVKKSQTTKSRLNLTFIRPILQSYRNQPIDFQ